MKLKEKGVFNMWQLLAVGVLTFILQACSGNNLDVPSDQWPIDHLPDQVSVRGYNLELYIQERKDEFTGHVEIDLEVSEPLHRLWIHGAGIKAGVIQMIGGTISTGEWRQHTPEGLASIVFDREIPKGHSKLIIDYSAPYSAGMKGFIRSADKNNFLASLADAGARYVVPGFDEPKFRGNITLSVNLPATLQALASTPITQTTSLENDRKVVQFSQTEKIMLGDLGVFVGELSTSNSVAMIDGYGTANVDLISSGMNALIARSNQKYPFGRLSVLVSDKFKEHLNAAGLIVNPSQEVSIVAQQLAEQWLVKPNNFRNWTTRCVAKGMARWAGLEAFMHANLAANDARQEAWMAARDIAKNSLGQMCWDVPNDLVLPEELNEDHTLIAGALYQLEAAGSDVANIVWSDNVENGQHPRMSQDLPAMIYQRIYPVLQNGQLMPHRCQAACEFSWQDTEVEKTIPQALEDPLMVTAIQWRHWLGDSDVKAYLWDVFERAKGFPPVSAQRVYGEAWQVAFGLAMQKDFDHWSSYLRRLAAEAEDNSVRMNALYALTETTDERVVAWFQQLLLNKVLSPSDEDDLFARLMMSPQASQQLSWFSTNRDKLMRKLTPAQRVIWLDALGGLCGEQFKPTVIDAMQPVAKMIFRGEARLARALSKIDACGK
jgi:hypothetical protein